SKLPAGTTTVPFASTVGSAEPQVTQNDFTNRVFGRRKVLTVSSPLTQVNSIGVENRFAAWAEPVSFRHRPQWQGRNRLNSPVISNATLAHRQDPEYFFMG